MRRSELLAVLAPLAILAGLSKTVRAVTAAYGLSSSTSRQSTAGIQGCVSDVVWL